MDQSLIRPNLTGPVQVPADLMLVMVGQKRPSLVIEVESDGCHGDLVTPRCQSLLQFSNTELWRCFYPPHRPPHCVVEDTLRFWSSLFVSGPDSFKLVNYGADFPILKK
ncbi:hypothetical protein ILYODFUR_005984 [Ilyodon furcidens]|uniref:Uncharacterized protein n=1 Tax=Ilyodon furcidens TaxID=33524 RepID=A0ABV0U330_9TELE